MERSRRRAVYAATKEWRKFTYGCLMKLPANSTPLTVKVELCILLLE